MTTLTAAQNLQIELEQERKQLRFDAALTGLTALGLILGVIFQITDAAAVYKVTAFFIAFLAGGIPPSLTALSELRQGRLDIDLLMVLAALAAAAVGEARDGAILLFLFSLASTLEAYAMGNTKRAVASLMQLRPDEATLRLAEGQTRRVAVEELNLGDTVLVKAGERIPVDGLILTGQSAIDQSSVTGESVPVDKAKNDPVFAGTVNGPGVLELTVTKHASESTLARMITLVTEAQSKRSPSERFSDWFGQRYTLFVLLGSALALGIFLLIGMPQATAFYKAATLLVVASPCAIVISVPAAILSALAATARNGVLFKGGAALEDFGNIDTFAFDKTGTLTEGKMRVTDVIPLETNERTFLQLATTLEAQSEHPIAKSILSYAAEKGITPEGVTDTIAIPGKGLSATVGTETLWAGNYKLLNEQAIAVSKAAQEALEKLEVEGKTPVIVGNRSILGVIGVADTVRPSAQRTLNALRAAGLKRFVMLTGDHSSVAHAVAQDLGIPEADVFAELLPEDKVSRIKDLSQSARVAFLGDGVNDAAALATSSVGVAMGTAGTDVALEAADVALLSDDLERLPETYLLARKANRVIRQNLSFALGIMIVMVLATLFWHLPLPLGVIGHEGGTLLVVANGLRLLAWRPVKHNTVKVRGKRHLSGT